MPGATGEDDAKELKKLKKRHRRLEQELEYRTQLLQKTDELYRTSERVLTQAHKDLEGLIERNNAMQQELNQVSRMAAVGEVSARVIHEVLNPMTAMMGRIQRARGRVNPSDDEDGLSILGEILEDWGVGLKEQTLATQVAAAQSGETPDFGEDLEDAATVVNVLAKERDALRADLDFMDKTGQHMVRIINGMRSLGHNEAAEELHDLNALVRDAVDLTRDTLKIHQIHVVERYQPKLPGVRAVANEIIQILTNLLGNAQHALRDGGTVQVETRVTPERLEVRVIDDGCGIDLPADQRDLIFEGGFTTKPKQEGTGLGLSICRRFARKAQGDIVIDWTRAGEGTSILLWLPIDPVSAPSTVNTGPQ